jgi:NTE family protein
MKGRKMLIRVRRETVAMVASAAMVAGLSAVALPAQAAESAKPQATAKRAKICLVLSGGGARGAAHVGVLKVLEEYRVPIDCIAGTSMGSLVGAAYATGTSVAEMETINQSISVELLFKENPPRQDLGWRRKQDDYRDFIGPEIGVGKGSLTLSKGLVSGVQLETVLRQLTKAKGYYRFDDLPIPFRGVATDLVTGKAVVFKDGELANVMRASMSVPGAVAPAEFGGMMLVDGMLTSNLPVDAARAMGADIVIAVNVGTPLLKREELNGIMGITGQMLSILTEQNVQASLASLKPTDILISPELGDYTTGDFDNLPKISPLGEAAARKVAERLLQLSLPPAQYAALRQRQQARVETDLRAVDEVRIAGLNSVNPATVRAAMDTAAGQPIDQKKLDADMRRIFGTGDFEHVNYSFLEEQNRRILAVDAVEKTWGLDTIRLGLGLTTDFAGDALFNLLVSYRKKWINSLGAEWRTDAQIGPTAGVITEFYQPFEADGPFFVAPHASLERRGVPVFTGEDQIGSYDLTYALAGFDLGAQLLQYGEIRLGVVAGTMKPDLSIGAAYLSPKTNSIGQGAYTFKLALDQLDSLHFPREGWRAGARVYDSNKALGADAVYTKWDADVNGVYSLGDHTLNVGLKAGGKIGSHDLPGYDQFQWGGFLQQSGYAPGQLLGGDLLFGRVVYYHRVRRGTLLEGMYAGVSLEVGRVDDPLVAGNPSGTLKSGSLFLAADSPLGPAYLGYGRSTDGNANFYFFIGRPF